MHSLTLGSVTTARSSYFMYCYTKDKDVDVEKRKRKLSSRSAITSIHMHFVGKNNLERDLFSSALQKIPSSAKDYFVFS